MFTNNKHLSLYLSLSLSLPPLLPLSLALSTLSFIFGTLLHTEVLETKQCTATGFWITRS